VANVAIKHHIVQLFEQKNSAAEKKW